jgi:hypothetical protein
VREKRSQKSRNIELFLSLQKREERESQSSNKGRIKKKINLKKKVELLMPAQI